jgi:hypothetical protein
MKHERLVEIYNILRLQWYVVTRNAVQHNDGYSARCQAGMRDQTRLMVNTKYGTPQMCGPQTAVDAALTAVIPNGMEGICQVR